MYLILACDGIWDVMTNQDAGEFVARKVAERLHDSSTNNLAHGEVLARVGDDLVKSCLAKESRDNMSVLIVALPASGLNSSALSLATMEKEPKGNLPSAADVTVRTLAFE
jgi:serine/threonine protein phosphatase PrpC